MIGGHSDPESSFGEEVIGETKTYLEDFNRIVEACGSPEEIYGRIMGIYPTRLNPGSLWAGAKVAKKG